MNTTWVICLAPEDAASLGSLRVLSGIEAAETDKLIWLRGQSGSESLEAKLAALPDCGRFELLPSNDLRCKGQRVPSARLPELRWQPLNRWLQIALPPAALPANLPESVALHLVRSTQERKPELLLTTLESFRHFVRQAAKVRLDCLQFAADGEKRLLVRRTPLPPISGQRFAMHGGVAVPLGFTWEPRVSEEALARRFGISGDTIVLWNEDGSVTRLHGEQFIPVTRSAVLATARLLEAPQ